MKITLRLSNADTIFHKEIITLPEDKIEVVVDNNPYLQGELILSLKNGDTEKQYKVGKEPVDIREMFNDAGEVCGALTLLIRGKVAKVWQVEPLCAIVTPSGIELIPEIEYLKARVSTLERALVELKTIVE